LIARRIDDPEAAASFTAPLLTADKIASIIGRLAVHPAR